MTPMEKTGETKTTAFQGFEQHNLHKHSRTQQCAIHARACACRYAHSTKASLYAVMDYPHKHFRTQLCTIHTRLHSYALSTQGVKNTSVEHTRLHAAQRNQESQQRGFSTKKPCSLTTPHAPGKQHFITTHMRPPSRART